MRGALLVLAAAVVVLFVAFFAIVRSTGNGSVDCGAFALRPGQWQATPPDDRSDLQLKIARCRALGGKSAGEVQALLGAPTAGAGSEELVYRFGPGDVRSMTVRLQGGRVTRVGRADATTPPPS